MKRIETMLNLAGVGSGEAVLIHKPSNMFYLSGYTGEGLLAVGSGFQAIVTDFRYTEQAERQAPGWQVLMVEKGVSHAMLAAKVFAEHEIKAVRYEDDEVTVRSFEKLKKDIPGVEFSPLNGAPEKVRRIKDEKELKCIEEACDNPDAMDAKNAMQIAAFYGGLAITASGTTGVHALSYPLGGKYHIAHGVSNAILLVPVMKFNEPVCRKRFAECYDRCAHDGSRCETEEEKSAWIIRRLDEIVKHLEIPTSLSRDFGVPEEDLEGLVQAGMQVTRLLVNNMREITPDDARAIYRQVL